MRFTFEPNDGSFEIILEKDESVRPDWNVPGNTILREIAPNEFTVVKKIDEILESI